MFCRASPQGEIELIPQPELTLSGSVHCLEAPLCQLDTRVKSPSNHRLRGRVRSLSSPTETPKARFRTVFAPG